MTEKFRKTLPVKLTEDELAVRRDELVAEVQERAAVDQVRKDSAAAYREQLKAHDAEIWHLARVIKDRAEDRLVECYEEPNHERGIMETIRCDTGEVVSARTMQQSERQVVLFEVGETA